MQQDAAVVAVGVSHQEPTGCEALDDIAKGRTESLRLAIETAADLLGIEISDARRESIDALDADGLTVLLGVLREEV